MIFSPTPLAGSYVIEPAPFSDSRGWFARVYCKNEFQEIGHSKEWVQINHSFTAAPGAIRGMHYQRPPFSEIKLVRCIAGAVYDVMIDLRKDSASFLQWFGVELSAGNRKMLYIPEGFAHGFQTLTPGCELIYHHSAFYTPGAEAAIRFDDPAIGIQWPQPPGEVSDRDRGHPLLTGEFTGLQL
jgi:dTDP-4-dehydrorhamnose 3,5-epimerase